MLKIGFPVFPHYTHLDFAGPWEVLARLPDAQCLVLAHELTPVAAGGGLTVVPDTRLSDCPQLDVLCVPGGGGTLAAMEDQDLLRFLQRQAEGCAFVTSVCTGSLVLAAAGLLRGYRATTHWQSFDRLAAFGAIPVAGRVVVDRNRVTGGGVTAGIDFAFTLGAKIAGETWARQTALQMEYAPAPPFSGDPKSADAETRAAIEARMGPYRQRMRETDARVLARLTQPGRTS